MMLTVHLYPDEVNAMVNQMQRRAEELSVAARKHTDDRKLILVRQAGYLRQRARELHAYLPEDQSAA